MTVERERAERREPAGDGTATVMATVRTRTDELVASLWDPARLDPAVTELCRLRVAQLLGDGEGFASRTPGTGLDEDVVDALPRWPTDPRFDRRWRRALGFAEQYVLDPSGVTDDDAARMHEDFTEPELTTLTLVLAVFDALSRTRLALAAAAAAGPSTGGR